MNISNKYKSSTQAKITSFPNFNATSYRVKVYRTKEDETSTTTNHQDKQEMMPEPTTANRKAKVTEEGDMADMHNPVCSKTIGPWKKNPSQGAGEGGGGQNGEMTELSECARKWGEIFNKNKQNIKSSAKKGWGSSQKSQNAGRGVTKNSKNSKVCPTKKQKFKGWKGVPKKIQMCVLKQKLLKGGKRSRKKS